ncbi:MAG: nucleotide-binding protein [Vicinamibacterales bacterium]
MAKINPKLLDRLEAKLGVTKNRIYRLIEDKVRETHLPRHLAAVALASARGINISKFASEAELQEMRNAPRASGSPPVAAREAPPSREAGSARNARPSAKRKPAKVKGRRNSVFVVHGRDLGARDELFTFLSALGLRPIEWNQAIKKTKQASPYVGTILDAAFAEAVAIIVLLTPDDEVRLKRKFRDPRDHAEATLTGQARPNVLFEAGMAFGRNPNNTILVQLGDLREFSDVAGRHLVHLGDDAKTRREFATKLENAGCDVDTSGSHWLTAGKLRAS